MIRRIVTALILIPLALLIVLFAVGNRAPVTVALDPIDRTTSTRSNGNGGLPGHLVLFGRAAEIAGHPDGQRAWAARIAGTILASSVSGVIGPTCL